MSTKKEPTELQRNISLKNLTTFKIGGPAKYFLAVNNKEQIIEAISWAQENFLLFFILAGGSNLLVNDRGFDGLVIKLQTTNYKLQTNIIHAEAGVRLSDLVKLSIEQGLSGLEWAAGIPQATVGGAIWGNAGAFGETIGEIVQEVETLQTANGKLQTIKKDDCGFGYKNSIFKKDGDLIISSADLILKEKDKEEVKKKVMEILDYRKEHHPIEPSAGSVFKNIKVGGEVEALFKDFPEAKVFEAKREIPAGWLIEQCGLRGERIGGAQISLKHANFIVNTGSSSAVDVVALIKLAQQKVKERFGIVLEEEIQYLGF